MTGPMPLCSCVRILNTSPSPMPDTSSIMIDGTPSRNACSALVAWKCNSSRQCGSEVVYPEGLNGDFELIWAPLPKQSVWDAESTNEPAMLQVNLPRPACRDVTMAACQWSLMPISSPMLCYRVPE